ncbi:hypothetical protein QWY85_10805 [Neolewinella lacunae]|uniref:Uncharacterized protein n=1 Tax=Neolewinella lacunae TaxID=1517758 RepID=A0A923PLB6_9BACT|nr:hypothetical protein [Neolewinella lacunae]MBC6993394.1 hypothetical protein [Neolewinella lacunae]MDN3635148.1 hypothetical protein [Neolewinella lacunae]
MYTLFAIVIAAFLFVWVSQFRLREKGPHLKNDGPKKQSVLSSRSHDIRINVKAIGVNNYKEYNLKAGDVIKLWPEPGSKNVLIYPAVKNVGDELPIASFESSLIANAYPSKKYRISATVKEISGSTLILDRILDVVSKDEERRAASEDFFEKISKPTQKSLQANIKFLMDDEFQWNSKVYLAFGDLERCIHKSKELNDWEVVKEAFWINNEFGQKVSLRNGTLKPDVIKILRNYKSNHVMHLKYSKGQRGAGYGRGGYYSWDCKG